MNDIVWDGKGYREITVKEIAELEQGSIKAECRYWLSPTYDEAVNAEIRKRYSESQEFAILRQATAKPEEYEAYFAYCEECKAYVKSKKAEYFAE